MSSYLTPDPAPRGAHHSRRPTAPPPTDLPPPDRAALPRGGQPEPDVELPQEDACDRPPTQRRVSAGPPLAARSQSTPVPRPSPSNYRTEPLGVKSRTLCLRVVRFRRKSFAGGYRLANE